MSPLQIQTTMLIGSIADALENPGDGGAYHGS